MESFMRFPFSRGAWAVLILAFCATGLRAQNFYHSLPTAKSAIDFDNRGFLIHGQRTFLASAGIEYARVPRALWRDRLLRIKRAGFNCVEIYTFWNYHEIKPGVFDFTGDKDVGAFLDLAHEMGLYVTVRVGPYVCAEWENGGFPMWLRYQPGLRIRGDDPAYLKFVDRWYNQILPIVAAHQISRGGSVIMVQLENEHPEGWGAWDLRPDEDDYAYFKDLLDSARAHGIDVLTFFSGMNHGGDPAPKDPISSARQPNPWFTTEFWSGWYSMYGPFSATGDNSLTRYDRAAWRFLENGGNGFNVYMFHGGTNFGTWNNNETAASYDYAGAIGQAGDLRPIYYKYKRVALFGRSFQDILENCDDASAAHANDFPGLTVRARTGPAGTLVFLDNPGTTPVDAKFPDGQVLTVLPGEVLGLVHDFPLDAKLKLDSSEVRILGTTHEGTTSTIVVYGPAGTTGQLTVAGLTKDQVQSGIAAGPGAKAGQDWSEVQDGKSTLKVTFSADAPSNFVYTDGNGETVRVIAMSDDLADKTYFIDTKPGTYIATGAPYIGDFTPDGKGVHFTMETPIDATMAPAVSVYAPAGNPPEQKGGLEARLENLEQAVVHHFTGPRDQKFDPLVLHPVDTTAPTLANWQSAPADLEAAPNYDDSKWLAATDPPPMGLDGDGSAYAWYRTTLHADAAGTQYLEVPFIGDQAIVFLNGTRLPGTWKGLAQVIPLPLTAGVNTLAILTSHNGRSKLDGTFGRIDRIDRKGLVGPIRLTPTPTPYLPIIAIKAQGYWKEHPIVMALVSPHADTTGKTWAWVQKNVTGAPQRVLRDTLPIAWDPHNMTSDFGYTPGTWREPFVAISALLPDLAGPNRMLHVGVVDEKATFYLNGTKIGEQLNARTPQPSDLLHSSLDDTDLPLDSAWKDGGPNELAVILENAHRQATLGLVIVSSGPPGTVINNWKMRGNVTDRTSPSLVWTSTTPTTAANPPGTSPTGTPASPANAPSNSPSATSASAANSPPHSPPAASAPAPGVPTYYHTAFTIPADYYKDATPILRLSSKGMSRGFAWLNGHNLGRYPDKVPVDGLYLPECWLKVGTNDLTVLDEEGNAIAPEHLYVELPASRRVVQR
jgi:beta-galactosidase